MTLLRARSASSKRIIAVRSTDCAAVGGKGLRERKLRKSISPILSHRSLVFERHTRPEIFEEVSRTPDGQSLDWRDVRALFGIQRRAASRIIARLQAEASRNGNRVDRAQLLDWLEPIKARADQRARAVQFAHKLREVEAEKQARRDAFRARFGMTTSKLSFGA